MKISTLRKVYPYLYRENRNVKWRKLTDSEFETSKNQLQKIANCFDEATRYALLNSTKGKEYLRNRIRIQKGNYHFPAYKINLNVNGKNENFRTYRNDYFSTYKDITKDYAKHNLILTHNRPTLSQAINIAVCKMVEKHPKMKPFYLKLHGFPIMNNRNCEFNKPSNAFKWFTGKTPIAIGESGLNLTLKKHKNEVLDLLNDLGNSSPKDYSFVVLNGFKKIGKCPHSWHTMAITNVDSKKQTISIIDKRSNTISEISFDDVVNRCKAIVGIKHEKEV